MHIAAIGLMAIVSATMAVAQSIPNPGFETWTNHMLLGPYPNGWMTTNGATQDRNLGYGVSQTADAAQGSSAAKITTGHMFYEALGIDDTTAMLMSGNFNIMQQREYPGFPYTQRPAVLRCQYKYFPMPPVGQDTGRIYVHFHKWNAGAGRHDIIGTGALKLTDTVAVYTQVDIPISWSSSEIPDSAHIELVSSLSRLATGYAGTATHRPIMGTTLYVDTMEFIMPVAVTPSHSGAVVMSYQAPEISGAARVHVDLRGRRIGADRAPERFGPGVYLFYDATTSKRMMR